MAVPSVVSVSPGNGTTGQPRNLVVEVLFDRELDVSRLNSGTFFVEGPENVITQGPDQALLVDRDPNTLDDILSSVGYKGIVKGAFTFSRLSTVSTDSGPYFDYSGTTVEFRHKVVFTPEKPLAPNTEYTVYLVGDEVSSDSYRTGISTRTVFDPVKGTNSGNGSMTPSGGYTGEVDDRFFVTILSPGITGEATYEWYKQTQLGVLRTGTTSTGPRLLVDGVYIKFSQNSTFVAGDTFEFVVKPPQYMLTTYSFSFTTGSQSLTSVPTSSTLITSISSSTTSSSSSSSSGSSSTSGFEVEETIPANRATNLSVSSIQVVTVVFSADIDPSSLAGIKVQREAVDGNLEDTEPEEISIDTSVSGDTLEIQMQGSDFFEANRVYVITLPETLADVDGNELETDYQFYFSSTYTGMYTSLRRLRLEYGSLLTNIPDDTINLAIYVASRTVDSLLTPLGIVNTSFWNLAKKEFTTCYAARLLLSGAASGGSFSVVSGGSKALDDLRINKGNTSNSEIGIKDTLLRLDECVALWLLSIQSGGDLGPNNPLRPKMTVKGDLDPDRYSPARMIYPDRYSDPALNTTVNTVGSRRSQRHYVKRCF